MMQQAFMNMPETNEKQLQNLSEKKGSLNKVIRYKESRNENSKIKKIQQTK